MRGEFKLMRFTKYLYAVILALFLVSCNIKESNDNIIINVGDSTKFTKEEIDKAMICVKYKFNISSATLTQLSYNEEKSNDFVENYLHYGKGSVNGVKSKNVIVILSNFSVDNSGNNPVLTPNSFYKDYSWILLRDNKNADWYIDDCGY